MNGSNRVHRRPFSYWLSMLLLGGLVAGLVIFFWLGTVRHGPAPVNTARAPASADAARKEMVVRDVILEGRDEEGKPFRIEAVRSRRPEKNRHTLILENAVGRIGEEADAPVHFRARKIIYHQESHLVELTDKVVIEKPGKWTLTGPLVHVDTRNSTMQTDRPVVVQTDTGVVHARGMRSDTKSGRTIFTGPVHAIFETASEEDTAAE